MARKTHTSSEVKNRYNAKTYKRFTVSVKKDRAEQFEAKLQEDGIENYSTIFHDAIDRFMAGDTEYDIPELIAQVEDLRKTSWENSSDKYYAGATMAYDNVLQLIKEINTDR